MFSSQTLISFRTTPLNNYSLKYILHTANTTVQKIGVILSLKEVFYAMKLRELAKTAV